tara:strand:- start:6230 stop:8818 length:2589 start_codon:yes stop_codon:yes gene_type:complete
MIKKLKILLGVETKQAEKNIDNVGKKMKSVGVAGKVAQGGLGLMSKGFKSVGLAMKAAGIGLFLGLLSQLTGLFQSNQKTADTFQRIMLKLQPVFDAVGKVIEVVATVLEKLIDLFTGAIGWIGKLIGVTDGATSSSDNFANSLVEQRKQVKLLEAELAGLQLQYQKEAELMRQIRDDESLSMEERIKANFELGKVLEEQLRHERSIAEQSLSLAEMELSINKDNLDLQVLVIDAKTKLAEIDERITGQRSEQLTNLNSLNRESEAKAKEAAAQRQEQLKKEAELIQDLIDLQNEDIDVKKRAARTLNEQFKNAEQANEAQVEELQKRMNKELEAHKNKVKNAKENIELQKEEVKVQEDSIAKNITENEKRNKSEKDLVSTTMKMIKMGIDTAGIEGLIGKYADQHEEAFDELMNRQVTSIEEIDQFQKDFTEISGQALEDAAFVRQGVTFQYYEAVTENVKKQGAVMVNANADLARELENTSDFIEENSLAIIEMSEESAQNSLNILDNSNATEKAIREKYANEIKETEQGVIDTKKTLQQQADEALFLHFEEVKDREIRLAEEKYDDLIGKAQGNAEATAKLEKQKTEALGAIEQSYIDKQEQAKTEFYKYIEVEELNVREKELNALQAHLDKVLALEGLTDQQRLEAEEEYIRQYDEVTGRHRSEDLEKEKENKRKMTDLALSSMHSIVDIAGLGAQKEIGELEKKFKNGAISEEKFNKEKNKIEEKQRKKEKKAALAQIAIDTGRQISSAYTAALSAAAAAGPGAPVVTPMLVAQMLAIVFAGVAQAKGALGASGGGGAEGGVNDVGGVDDDMGAGAVPSINFGAAGNEQPPVQAFVVETDISNAQALQSELDLQSTL